MQVPTLIGSRDDIQEAAGVIHVKNVKRGEP